jgi:TolB-like protein
LADVFLSYARSDRAVAERLAHAIADSGLSVWWDRHIKGGAEFSRDIETELDAAAKIVVLWSKEAVVSRWVRDEASVAADSKRLVGVTIDGTPPPLGFRQFQTIDLQRWAASGATIPPELADALDVQAIEQSHRTPRARPRSKLIAGSFAALLLAAAATIAVVQPPPFDRLFSGESRREGLSLAIMPFAIHGDREGNYLGVGLAGALADSLTPLSGLKITATTSTQAVTGKGLTAPDIGKKLGVSHLVEGDVQQTGERYAISVRLIEAGTSEQVWARTFEGPSEELQELKNRMARELAGALRARLGVGQGQIAERRNVDPEAYEAYLRALERVSVRDARDARIEAIKQFRLAASIQPDFAEAHAGEAYVLALSLPRQLGISWQQLMADQHRSRARALELDPNNDFAMIAGATALKNFNGDADAALAIDRAVLKRSPDFGPAHYSMAASLWMLGRGREALDHLERAIERDPYDVLLQVYRAQILYSLGDYEGVRSTVQKCPEPCGGIGFLWFAAMVGFATPAQYRDDLPGFIARARTDRVPPDVIAESMAIGEAFILGKPYKRQSPLDDQFVGFVDAASAARLVGFEQGLQITRKAAANEHADSLLDILNEGRLTFTPGQRADPRYHQLFRHPKLAKIAAVRRREGVTAGLPVFPVKTYVGR